MTRSGETSIEIGLRALRGMKDVPRERWNTLHGTTRSSSTNETPYNPFLKHDFLLSLEEAGCVSDRTGWTPQHLVAETADGELIGAMPAYVKTHSQGEYIFDHGWADAFERAGGAYYPKLLSAVPFTPATGPRLLVGDGNDRGEARAVLARGLSLVTDRLDLSSAHVNFVQDADAEALMGAGYLLRTDRQFHWHNEGYASYDEFLSTLTSRKRKALRKERREALASDGVGIDWLTGTDLSEAVWDSFFQFYMDTGARKWGRPYLNRRFFSLLGERMGEDVLLVMAKRGGRWIAGALNLIGGDTLYARHWGCIEHHPSLHFEVCYHQAIDYAIAHGLKTVEAGAQGEHKLARGYSPVITKSCHYIPNQSFRRAVANYLEHERREIALYAEVLGEHGPFRRGARTDADAYRIEHREVEEQE